MAKRQDPVRINIDLPPWALEALDREAARRGVTRQSLVKVWIVEMLDELEKAEQSLKQAKGT